LWRTNLRDANLTDGSFLTARQTTSETRRYRGFATRTLSSAVAASAVTTSSHRSVEVAGANRAGELGVVGDAQRGESPAVTIRGGGSGGEFPLDDRQRVRRDPGVEADATLGRPHDIGLEELPHRLDQFGGRGAVVDSAGG